MNLPIPGYHSFSTINRSKRFCALVKSLQPVGRKVLNIDKYFQRPASIGYALRVFK